MTRARARCRAAGLADDRGRRDGRVARGGFQPRRRAREVCRIPTPSASPNSTAPCAAPGWIRCASAPPSPSPRRSRPSSRPGAGGGGGERPKSEVRRPKEVRSPKSEGRRPSAAERGCFSRQPRAQAAGCFLGFRISAFLRLSDFGFRISLRPSALLVRPTAVRRRHQLARPATTSLPCVRHMPRYRPRSGSNTACGLSSPASSCWRWLALRSGF